MGSFPQFPDFYWKDFCKLLIIKDLRDLAWNIGIMEYWNDGLGGGEKQEINAFRFLYPVLHFSTIPLWMAPLLQQILLMDNGVLDKIEETPGSFLLTNRIGLLQYSKLAV
jgi:hypothetical protein